MAEGSPRGGLRPHYRRVVRGWMDDYRQRQRAAWEAQQEPQEMPPTIEGGPDAAPAPAIEPPLAEESAPTPAIGQPLTAEPVAVLAEEPRRRSTGVADARSPSERAGMAPTTRKSQGVYFGGLTPVDWDPRLDAPTRACFFCWSTVHGRRDCRREPRLCCLNCGRRGVRVQDCPRCKNPWFDLRGERRTPGSRPWALAQEEAKLVSRLARNRQPTDERRDQTPQPGPSTRDTGTVVPVIVATGSPAPGVAPASHESAGRSSTLDTDIRLAELITKMTPEMFQAWNECRRRKE